MVSEKRKEYMRNYMKIYARCHKKEWADYRRRRRLEILIHYGGNPPKCACCGETHIEFLTIDHIEGDGAEHRRKIFKNPRKGGGGDFYRWLKKNDFPEGFQVLCANCNMAKGRKKKRFCSIHHPELYRKRNRNL